MLGIVKLESFSATSLADGKLEAASVEHRCRLGNGGREEFAALAGDGESSARFPRGWIESDIVL